MTEKTEKNESLNLAQRLNLIRKDMLSAGLTKDGINAAQGYSYFKTDDMKALYNPFFVRHGVEIAFFQYDVQIAEPIGKMSVHVLVKGGVRLTNINDMGDVAEYNLISEAADSGDKAVTKAKTAMVKSFFTDSFLVSDGVEPDAEPHESKVPAVKNESAKQLLKDKKMPVKEGTTATSDSITKSDTKDAVAPAPAPKAKVKEEPVVEAVKEEPKATSAPAPAPTTAPAPAATVATGDMSEAQKVMCKKIHDKIVDQTAGCGPDWERMDIEYRRLKTRQDAIDFANGWRGYTA